VWSIAIQSVCLSYVCSHRPRPISKTTRPVLQIAPNLLYMLPATVARSSSDGSAIYIILPVLWMTSCFHIVERMDQNQRRRVAYMFRPFRGMAGGTGGKSVVCDYMADPDMSYGGLTPISPKMTLSPSPGKIWMPWIWICPIIGKLSTGNITPMRRRQCSDFRRDLNVSAVVLLTVSSCRCFMVVRVFGKNEF